MRLCTLIVFLIGAIVLGGSRSCAMPSDYQAWGLVASSIALDPERRYRLYVEAQPRIGDSFERITTVQLRSAITYGFNQAWSTDIGHAWTPLFMDADYHRIYRDEHRIWQGLTYSHGEGRIQWRHRLRQEQRFIEQASEVAHRTRYQLRLTLPLWHGGNVGITGFDEVMGHLNSVEGGPRAGYDRNRIFVGPFWRNGSTRYEFGYLGEHIHRVAGEERWINALLMTAVTSF